MLQKLLKYCDCMVMLHRGLSSTGETFGVNEEGGFRGRVGDFDLASGSGAYDSGMKRCLLASPCFWLLLTKMRAVS